MSKRKGEIEDGLDEGGVTYDPNSREFIPDSPGIINSDFISSSLSMRLDIVGIQYLGTDNGKVCLGNGNYRLTNITI